MSSRSCRGLHGKARQLSQFPPVPNEMTTPNGSDIPFEISNEQQNLRLLELPPSLLELIASKGLSSLELKSGAPLDSDGSNQAPANAVLCTHNQTFQVRQVQSSNSVFVLQPAESFRESAEDGIPSIAVSAIAKCAATLELVPISPSAVAILKHALPIYEGPESITASSSVDKTSREMLLENVPLSRGEFSKAWKEICAFELDGKAWLPAASTLASAWKSVISAATLRGVNLEDGFSMAIVEGVTEDDGYPSVLFRAVVDRLSSEDEELMDGYVILGREKTVPWVGTIFLQSYRNVADGIFISDLTQDWQNSLPEDWREFAILDVLKGRYSDRSNGRIVYEDRADECHNLTKPATSKASGKDARKWHEKFKNAKK